MRRASWNRLLTWVGAAAVALTMATTALADDRTNFLIERLKSDDFKVRTNAALALGGTNDDAAVQPLCGALSDSNDVVRQAAAAGLKKLARTSALGCLKSRLASEPSDAVKLQITRAIEAIEPDGGGASGGSGSSGAPKNNPNAKFYVSLSSIQNNTGRPIGEVDGVVFPAVRQKLDTLGHYQLAPQKETPEAAQSAMSKRSLKGYYLAILVDKFDYSNGNLSVKVKIAVFTYPGKDLRGEVPARLTQQGVTPPDKGAEDNLMGMAAARAVDLFAKNFD
jgi:hypothetical protein